MAQAYRTVTAYVSAARYLLQDVIGPPYRYTDAMIVGALDHAVSDLGRIRPDIFLDLKYQAPLKKGDIDEGQPEIYDVTDIGFLSDFITYDLNGGTLVPVPSKYISPINWYMAAWLQMYDTNDTTDQRAQGMFAKFQAHLMNLSAA